MVRMIDAALDYASRGWPVFPIKPGQKIPIEGSNGFLDATTDEAQIREWWNAYPTANIGFEPGSVDLMVADLDAYKGVTWDDVDKAVDGLPETQLRAKTPRGGEHEFYQLDRDESVPSSTSRFVEGCDIRSTGGYVLLPPSSTPDGPYEWIETGTPAYRTDEMKRLACSARGKHEKRQEWLIEPDLPENIEHATQWLSGSPVPQCGLKQGAKIAISGQGGDHTAYATAGMMVSFGLSREKASELMWGIWNPRCNPPWTADDADHLEQKITNAWDEYHTSPPGNVTPSYHHAKRMAQFKPVRSADIPSGNEWNIGPFRFVDREGMEHIRDPEWLVDGLLPRGSYAILFGSSSAGKTFIALDIALSICAGFGFSKETLWHKKIMRSGPVLYCAGEGRDQLKKRVRAWELEHYGGKQIEGFVLADPVPHVSHAHTVLSQDEDGEITVLDKFIEGAKQGHDEYELVIIDTVGRAMQGVNENAQEHASAFTETIERIQHEMGCGVLALHHAGHGHKDRERGSSVFGADADVRLALDRPGQGNMATLEMLKQKDAEVWKDPLVVRMYERAVNEEQTSLVVAKAGTIEASKAKTKKRKKELVDAQEKASYEQIEKAMVETLATNKVREWTQTKLCQDVAMREDVDVGSKRLHQIIVDLRENSDGEIRHHYVSHPTKSYYKFDAGRKKKA